MTSKEEAYASPGDLHLPVVSNALSGAFSAAWKVRIESAKLSIARMSKQPSQKTALTGTSFPRPTLPPEMDLVSQMSLIPQVSSKADIAVDEEPTSNSLVASFISADIKDKAIIRSRIREVIKQFAKESVSLETVQELVVLSTASDRDILLKIVNQLLDAIRDLTIFPAVVLQGLAVILNSYPEENDLSAIDGAIPDILDLLAERLKTTLLGRNDRQLLMLLQALTALLDAMVCRKVFALNSDNVLNTILTGLTSHDDATVSFLALYARQAQEYIGSYELHRMSIYRHGTLAIALPKNTTDTANNLGLSAFESMYRNFTEICDLSDRNAWYQGLIYVDCMMGRQDWPRLETFVLNSKLKSNVPFLQGLCLRFEQIAATQASEDICCGAIRFLQSFRSESPALVHEVAASSLQRLGINDVTRQPMEDTLAAPITRSINTFRPQGFQETFPPIWDPIWQFPSCGILLKATKDLYLQYVAVDSLPIQSNDLAVEIQTPSTSVEGTVEAGFALTKVDTLQSQGDVSRINGGTSRPSKEEIHAALQIYYEPFLNIQRISGEITNLESCYVNLEILRHIPNHEDITKTNIQMRIPFEELFIKTQLRDGRKDVPKTILIKGQAGIGKTTLCKNMVHAHQNGLWKPLFDTILWFPLHELRTFKARNFEDLLEEKYFSRYPKQKRGELMFALSDCIRNGKVLFILDGLDQIVADTEKGKDIALEELLRQLLLQEHVVITSRPSGVETSNLPRLDLELHAVGFSKQGVQTYLEKSVKVEVARAVREIIQNTPSVQDLAKIPGRLDVICYSWDSLASNERETTLAKLYQKIVQTLWRKDAVHSQKLTDGGNLTTKHIKDLQLHQPDNMIANGVEFLGYLAFKGMRNSYQIEFHKEILLDTVEELNNFREAAKQKPLPHQLLDILKHYSFFDVSNTNLVIEEDISRHVWSFMDLTFQEYFAATWLARHLQANHTDSTSHAALGMTMEQTTTFIQQHKYNPRYDIVWRMVAGQLENMPLEIFFGLLQGTPCDLIGGYHQRLLAGCLKEAKPRLNRDVVMKLDTEMMQWLYFDATIQDCNSGESILGRQRVLPEELLVSCLSQSKTYQAYALKALKDHPCLTSFAIQGLVSLLHNEDKGIRISAIKALGTHSTSSETAVVALISALRDEDCDVRDSSAQALRAHSTLPESAVLALVSALRDRDSNVKRSAAQALGAQDSLPESAILACIAILQSDGSDIKRSAAEVLGSQAPLSDFAILALIGTLKGEDAYLRYSAAQALGAHAAIPEFAIEALLGALADVDVDVGGAAIGALVAQARLSESSILFLIGALQDNDENLRYSAGQVLRAQTTLSEPVVKILIDALQYSDSYFRKTTASIMSFQESISESTTQTLIGHLQSGDKNLRDSAAQLLGAHPILTEPIILALTSAIRDEYADVRKSIVNALRTQSTLPEYAILALVGTLQDEDEDIRCSVVHVLGDQSKLSGSAILALARALQDKEWSVRRSAAVNLGIQANLPETVILDLVNALQDEDPIVRGSAAEALGPHASLSENALSALMRVIHDEDPDVRDSVMYALRVQFTLPEPAIQALIAASQDDDLQVRTSAVGTLGSQATLSESAIQTLVDFLYDENPDIRKSAIDGLGIQTLLSDRCIFALISALHDKHSIVRLSAVEALSARPTLSSSAIRALINTMQDKASTVRNSAIKVLAKHHNSIFIVLPELSASEIEVLYRCYLFRYSCEHPMSLFPLDNRLCFFTERGSGQTDPLSTELMEKIVSAFHTVQRAAGIQPIP